MHFPSQINIPTPIGSPISFIDLLYKDDAPSSGLQLLVRRGTVS